MASNKNPVEYLHEWYGDKVDAFTRIAQALLAEPESANWSDAQLAHELHQWLNAPDSFFNWVGSKQEGAEIVESVLRASDHANIAVETDGRWDEEDDSQWEYYAAHAFIADVMVNSGRGVGPYLGPNEEES